MSFRSAAALSAGLLLCPVALASYSHRDAADVSVEIVDERGVRFEQFPTRTTGGGEAYRAYLQAERGA